MKGHVYKRGESWTFVVDIGRDSSGKRIQKSKGGFKRKKDAETALRKILTEIDENKYIESSKEVFSSFITDWFYNHYKNRLRVTTASSREYMVSSHFIKNNPFADKPLNTITSLNIDLFLNQKLEQGLSTNYIRKMHQLLYQAFNQAIKWKKLSVNPVQDSDPPSVVKRDINIWSYSEIHIFLNECKNDRNYIVFLLAIYTGMRRGEILGLKWSDLDFNKKVIHVSRSLSYIPNGGYVITNLKTRSSNRKIPITEEVINELVKVKKQQEELKNKLGEAFGNNDLVVCTEFGHVQDPRNILRTMKRYIKLSNVTPIRFHDIRHTHASILISSGVDIVKIADRLGHSNPKTTFETYAHLLPHVYNDVAEAFENELKKNQ
ncbi:site-specific integrase [Cytobacillus pseudoceanisediminis]|uniref:Site-specific integrase n=1 Tax=Cytobacillus pseudoceanisediminis TaxID=3051614 RepID=A0ABZ2ZMY2_9BACI